MILYTFSKTYGKDNNIWKIKSQTDFFNCLINYQCWCCEFYTLLFFHDTRIYSIYYIPSQIKRILKWIQFIRRPLFTLCRNYKISVPGVSAETNIDHLHKYWLATKKSFWVWQRYQLLLYLWSTSLTNFLPKFLSNHKRFTQPCVINDQFSLGCVQKGINPIFLRT